MIIPQVKKEQLFEIAARAEASEDEDALQYGPSGFYYDFGKWAAIMEALEILGIRKEYNAFLAEYVTEKNAVNA